MANITIDFRLPSQRAQNGTATVLISHTAEKTGSPCVADQLPELRAS